MIVTTTHGEMDDSLLVKKVGSDVQDTHAVDWVEYWLGGELVHRSAHVRMLKLPTLFSEQGDVNG